jgi:hypothetical protein
VLVGFSERGHHGLEVGGGGDAQLRLRLLGDDGGCHEWNCERCDDAATETAFTVG